MFAHQWDDDFKIWMVDLALEFRGAHEGFFGRCLREVNDADLFPRDFSPFDPQYGILSDADMSIQSHDIAVVLNGAHLTLGGVRLCDKPRRRNRCADLAPMVQNLGDVT